MDWSAFRKEIRECRSCKLHLTRKHALPGEGDVKAGVFLIAQAPGPVENLSGKMFSGPSGKHFDQLLQKAGLTRDEVYLTNLVKCFLPKCRRPSRDEIQTCSRYLLREMEWVDPKILVPLGFHATRFLLMHFGLPRPPRKEFNQLFGIPFTAEKYMVFPLRHPTALLFDPGKRETMETNYGKLKKLTEKKE